ncbi:MAG: hypothetical protein ACREFX_13130 [Opitutaceae bacterium]
MTVVCTLWLPILLSAVFAFVASFILHVPLPWHKGDYGKVPDEDKVMDALRPFAIPAGDYMLPRPDRPKDMKSPEFAERLKKGPVVILTVIREKCFGGMGKNLALWFVYLLVISLLTAYVSCHALPVGAGHRRVFRIAGVTSFLGYAPALWQMSIWYQRSCKTTIKDTVDGLIYAALTAVTFACLWPR